MNKKNKFISFWYNLRGGTLIICYVLLSDCSAAGGLDVGTREADKVPLLPSQSTHLFTTGMRYSTGNEISLL